MNILVCSRIRHFVCPLNKALCTELMFAIYCIEHICVCSNSELDSSSVRRILHFSQFVISRNLNFSQFAMSRNLHFSQCVNSRILHFSIFPHFVIVRILTFSHFVPVRGSVKPAPPEPDWGGNTPAGCLRSRRSPANPRQKKPGDAHSQATAARYHAARECTGRFHGQPPED